jgi:hypothetical protein
MELGVTQVRNDVAQPVLPTVPAIELEPRRTGREIELIVRHQHLLGLNLPVAQRARYRQPAAIHEGRGLEQPDRLAPQMQLGGFAVQLGLCAKARTFRRRESVNKPEPGVVPGSEVFGPGIAQADDET